jgi:hypothetical protein
LLQKAFNLNLDRDESAKVKPITWQILKKGIKNRFILAEATKFVSQTGSTSQFSIIAECLIEPALLVAISE